MSLVKILLPVMVFGFKGVREHSLSVWLLIPLLFPLFPRFSLWQVKVKPPMQSWSCPRLKKSHMCLLMFLAKPCTVFLVYKRLQTVMLVHVMHMA